MPAAWTRGEAIHLSDFIQKNSERIVVEWVKFAGTLLPWAQGLDEQTLRDHAADLLQAIAIDMNSPQSSGERAQKSKGRGAVGALASVGQIHASGRLSTGLNLDQLLAEFRALRASVLVLWEEDGGEAQGEVTRFNEAIDEALAASTVRFSEMVSTTREQFLGIVGHDLRNPLSAIVMGASLLVHADSIDDKHARIALRILSSAQRMERLVGSLLDLTRTRLGSGIPISPKPMDLALACQQVISEFEIAQPDLQFRLEAKGDLRGEWDSDRLSQVLSNLVGNAVQYGTAEGTVTVVADGRDDQVVLRIHNEGEPIPEAVMGTLFEPMARRAPALEAGKNPRGLGLGLFIAREVVLAHRGSIEVVSTAAEGTTFTLKLPRSSPALAA